MKITKTHVEKYLILRSEVKEREEEMTGLKEKFMTALYERKGERIKTEAGFVTHVIRGYAKLDEAKLMKALKVTNLDAFKTYTQTESVLVTAA